MTTSANHKRKYPPSDGSQLARALYIAFFEEKAEVQSFELDGGPDAAAIIRVTLKCLIVCIL